MKDVLPLSEIIAPIGFSKAFDATTDYYLKEGREVSLDVYFIDGLFDYRLSYGGCDSPGGDYEPAELFDVNGDKCEQQPHRGSYCLGLHAHPFSMYNKDDWKNSLGFSEPDICSYHDDKTIGGVVCIISKRRANTLLWLPSKSYDPRTMQILSEELFSGPVEEQRTVLQARGTAERIYFERKNGIWQPLKSHAHLVDKFKIKNPEESRPIF